MTGNRLPVFFLKGVGQGLATALFRKEALTDPLEPMPTVPEWLASYGVTPPRTCPHSTGARPTGTPCWTGGNAKRTRSWRAHSRAPACT